MRKTALLFALLSASGPAAAADEYYGTLEPFASEAVYFVVTDRFVNGDPGNDQREQGGPDPATRTFDRPTPGSEEGDNVGYLGGDFKGVVEHLDYVRDMGFTALWITPIVDNPDQAFTGGKPARKGGFLTDGGKTGYHGYWGVNFYRLDEHLPSPGLDFAGLADAVHGRGMKLVLDIVANHGSPAYTMPAPQPQFGQVFDRDGRLVADHQNRPPGQLEPGRNPLHRFYNTRPGLAELSDFNENEPAVMEYLVGAYSQWIDQGADALRIDTIGWLPHPFWHEFVGRLRARRPGMFMFGEAFDYDPGKIAEHTWARNADVSVLDFPLRERLEQAFGRKRAGFEVLEARLYLQGGPYANPYELMTFYDNHDMPRLDASDEGFIDAHNWLFTARGIPVVYYGSEVGFMRGAAEHAGNRNYFGAGRIAAAAGHPIRENLKRIARVRAATPALQRGLQVNLELKGDRAAFYRVLQRGGVAQTALVLLNKGDAPARFEIAKMLQPGVWRAAVGGGAVAVDEGAPLRATVPAHGVEVYVLDGEVRQPQLRQALGAAMRAARRRPR
ncbi:alpha-amylase family glycosyl hydrolase [Vulcaniibacterium tengchongense]|uniref:Cyclomaltodextrin glucanotransferase n=1 Tax=Vulcaniibacterium tengchongense TaxID=1273429 RepID=A0A3N4VFE4_9GAMM|nr:alpha-amylase family glycosyl hydrolase [Vulcaniibacterium tengchongense]RPE75907.1 cyclomaltodextrin glucanotransferase [Vulcaniibacterium tengchongense]